MILHFPASYYFESNFRSVLINILQKLSDSVKTVLVILSDFIHHGQHRLKNNVVFESIKVFVLIRMVCI
jgi:hypothetical protein